MVVSNNEFVSKQLYLKWPFNSIANKCAKYQATIYFVEELIQWVWLDQVVFECNPMKTKVGYFEEIDLQRRAFYLIIFSLNRSQNVEIICTENKNCKRSEGKH